jgi:dTMP kinase
MSWQRPLHHLRRHRRRRQELAHRGAGRWLRGRGHVVVHARARRHAAGRALRELVLHQPMDALTEALLVFAARRDHLVQQIEPALARGAVVLCDRFTDATFAYQGGGRGFDLACWRSSSLGAAGPAARPDAVVRPAGRGGGRSAAPRARARPLRAQDEAFFERVRAGYARAAPQRRSASCASTRAAIERRSGADRGHRAGARLVVGEGRRPHLPLPWLARPLDEVLAHQRGPRAAAAGRAGIGSFEFALSLAQAWLCEASQRPRPCGHCGELPAGEFACTPTCWCCMPEAEALGLAGASGR